MQGFRQVTANEWRVTMTNLRKHADPISLKYDYQNDAVLRRGLVVVDIDLAIAALLVDRFTPAGAAIGFDARAPKCTAPRTDPDALETIKSIDHAWFAAHPSATEYVREVLPGEFEDELEPLRPEKRWAVKVTAFRDFASDEVMLRIRASVLVPANYTLVGGEK
jgi:hypothetical protein